MTGSVGVLRELSRWTVVNQGEGGDSESPSGTGLVTTWYRTRLRARLIMLLTT